MKILAADTSTAINTVAVCANGRLLAETIVECGRSHAERLLATVDWVLAEAGLELGDLDALAISIGPGSFTGLRVGTATWKGLAFAQKLALAAVPTLDAMTRLGAFRDVVVCPLLDARMGEVFGAVYRFDGARRTKLTADMVCPVETILEEVSEAAVFLGDGAAVYRDRILAKVPEAVFVEPLCSVPRASAVAGEAACLLAQGVSTDAAQVSPIYLRKSQAEENRDQARGGPG